MRPSEVAQWPLEELVDVAAYCALEVEGLDRARPATAQSEAPGRLVFHAAPVQRKKT